jgi:hypothetical protein
VLAVGSGLLEAGVQREREPRAEELPLVREAREVVLGGEDPQDVVACGTQPVARQLVGANPVVAGSAPEDDGTDRVLLDSQPLEVAQPVVDRGGVHGCVAPDLVAKPPLSRHAGMLSTT